jgi:DNA-binding transcriptional ArsR family regulator
MNNTTQLPRGNPNRKWGPGEILGIKDSTDISEIRRERAGKAATLTIANQAPKRAKKKATTKTQIMEILDAGGERSTRDLAGLIDGISINSVSQYLKELKAEEKVYKVGAFWISTQGLEK